MVSPMDSSDSRHLAQNLSLSAAENSSFVRPKGNYGRRISFSSRERGGQEAGGFEMKCVGEMEPRSPLERFSYLVAEFFAASKPHFDKRSQRTDV